MILLLLPRSLSGNGIKFQIGPKLWLLDEHKIVIHLYQYRAFLYFFTLFFFFATLSVEQLVSQRFEREFGKAWTRINVERS